MYYIHAMTDGGVMVSNTDAPYMAEFPAENQQLADQVVVGLNQPVMLAELATYRLMIETGGLELDGGMRLLTDRQSQAQLNIAYADLKNGLIPDTDLKADNSWEVVNLEQMQPIAKALAVHRRACFRAERVITTAIQSADTPALQVGINIQADFMTAYQAAVAEVSDTAQ